MILVSNTATEKISTLQTSVVAMSIPSASASTAAGNYTLARCTAPILADLTVPFIEKCAFADCQGVKANALAQWQAYPTDGDLSFLDIVGASLGPVGDAGWYCAAQYEDTCSSSAVCTDVTWGTERVYDWPGAWLLALEIDAFTQFYRTIFEGFDYNFGITTPLAGEFCLTFAPVTETSTLWTKIFIALAGAFGGQILGIILRKTLLLAAERWALANPELITQSKLFASNLAIAGGNMGVNLDVP